LESATVEAGCREVAFRGGFWGVVASFADGFSESGGGSDTGAVDAGVADCVTAIRGCSDFHWEINCGIPIAISKTTTADAAARCLNLGQLRVQWE